jgi:hypothetical protein
MRLALSAFGLIINNNSEKGRKSRIENKLWKRMPDNPPASDRPGQAPNGDVGYALLLGLKKHIGG